MISCDVISLLVYAKIMIFLTKSITASTINQCKMILTHIMQRTEPVLSFDFVVVVVFRACLQPLGQAHFEVKDKLCKKFKFIRVNFDYENEYLENECRLR